MQKIYKERKCSSFENLACNSHSAMYYQTFEIKL